MAEKTSKRKSKDSVFVDLFSDVNYVLQFYKELHPEDTDVTVKDIDIKTIKSVLVNTLYNDLGFIVRDKLVMLVEAQSLWNPNIALRFMFYLSETYRRYLSDTVQSEHSSIRVKLPRPELFVVYSGEKKIPDEVSLNNDFFDGKAPVDIKIKVLTNADKTICGQYIGFCKVFDEQRRIYKNKIDCAKSTLKICIEKGYLVPYFEKREKEAVTMMEELFDEDYLREQYNKAECKRSHDEGKIEGKIEGKAETIKGIIERLREMGISEEQIKAATAGI